MSEKFLDQSGLVVLRNWVRSQILSAGLGGSGLTFDAERLWVNASPLTNFARYQSVPVDLSGYDGAIIEYAASAEEAIKAPIFSRPIAIGDGDKLMSVGTLSNFYGGRFCAILRDKVYFGEPLNHSTSINEAVSIPIAIYGVNGAYQRKRPDSETTGRTYLVKPYDPYAGLLTGFGVTKQQNGNDVYTCGWGLGQAGLGFQMVTKGESNSHAMMISNEAISITQGQTIRIRGFAICYNGNDYFFLIKKSDLPSDIYTATRTAANMYALASGGAKMDLVSSANSLTRINPSVYIQKHSSAYTVTINDGNGNSSFTNIPPDEEFYLAFMLSGTSSYYGKICIEEMYIE